MITPNEATDIQHGLEVAQDIAWGTAEEKGWHSIGKSLLEELALVHSEVSEAVEAYRRGDNGRTVQVHEGKPYGLATELADVLIRILDLSKHFNIPLAEALLVKMRFNETRPFRHGGKRA